MSDTPTEPGYYWHRQIDEGSQEVFEWEVVQVLSDQDGPESHRGTRGDGRIMSSSHPLRVA